MSNQKYSGEVNLDHPAIDERVDGIYLYFHDLPPSYSRTPSATQCPTRTTRTTRIKQQINLKASAPCFSNDIDNVEQQEQHYF